MGRRSRWRRGPTISVAVLLLVVLPIVWCAHLRLATVEIPVSALGVMAPNTAPDLSGTLVAEHAVRSAGAVRTYRSILPAQTAPTARLPLMVVLSGRGEGGWTAVRTTGFLPFARAGRAVLIYPDAIGRSWNAGGGCCGVAARLGVPDRAFVNTAVEDAIQRLPVDPAHVYLVGYSNGGKLAYALACADPLRYAGVATYGAVPLAPCPSAAPLPFVLAAGEHDSVLPFDGAPRARPTTTAVPEAAAGLASRDRCAAPSRSPSNGTAVVTRWTGCAAGSGVVLLVFPSGTHTWPTTLAAMLGSYLNVPSPVLPSSDPRRVAAAAGPTGGKGGV